MSAKIINGIDLANNFKKNIHKKLLILNKKFNTVPGLAIIVIGKDPASLIYVSNKLNETKKLGIKSWKFEFPIDVKTETILNLIKKLNQDDKVNGIIVQLPIPSHLNKRKLLDSISPQKDVDGLNYINAGLLSINEPKLIPCTPLACILLLKSVITNLSGLHAVIIGRSNLVGKPLANLLLQYDCSVTIIHSKSTNIEKICTQADILISSVGKANIVSKKLVKLNATVIDVGINKIKNKLTGDVNFDEVKKIAYAITPVPGGVGPMTIACLMQNTLTATIKQKNIKI